MDVEHRVQALEKEVELLRLQIQATLLEMHELMLTSTYPVLHPGDSTPEDNPDDTPTLPRPPKGLRQVRVTDAPQDTALPTPEEPPAAPPSRMSMQPALPAASHDTEPVRTVVAELDWETLEKLENWLSSKIEKMGARRTRELVQLYGDQGHFSTDVVETLLSLLKLYERPANTPQTSAQTPVAAAPAKPSAPEKREPAVPSPKRPKSELQPQKSARELPPSKRTVEIEADLHKRNLILKLIAGVQTNGTNNVDWKKTHG